MNERVKGVVCVLVPDCLAKSAFSPSEVVIYTLSGALGGASVERMMNVISSYIGFGWGLWLEVAAGVFGLGAAFGLAFVGRKIQQNNIYADAMAEIYEGIDLEKKIENNRTKLLPEVKSGILAAFLFTVFLVVLLVCANFASRMAKTPEVYVKCTPSVVNRGETCIVHWHASDSSWVTLNGYAVPKTAQMTSTITGDQIFTVLAGNTWGEAKIDCSVQVTGRDPVATDEVPD